MTRSILAAVLLLSVPALADDYVDGYVKKDGTYVQPHYRSEKNDTKADNWSSKPNVNPYTGEKGTKDPYAPRKSSSKKSRGY